MFMFMNSSLFMSHRDAHVLRALISIQGSVPSVAGHLRSALSALPAEPRPAVEDPHTRRPAALNDRLTLRPVSGPETEEFHIQVVLPPLSNPAEGRISLSAPMSQAVLGRYAGEVVTVETPAGPDLLQITHIQKA